MSGRTKRRFVSLLSARELEIKEVLVEFIERYVEFQGNIGVVKLDGPGSSRTAKSTGQ